MNTRIHTGRADGKQQFGVLFFFFVCTLALTYPLVVHMGDGVLGPPGDNFEYLFKLAWFKESIFGGLSPFFTPDVFYPQGYPLALHEMSLAHVALGMPVVLVAGQVVGYNTLLVLSFVLSGYGAYLLALRTVRQQQAAIVAGCLYAFSSYRMGHLAAGHLNLMGTQWLPFMLLALGQFLHHHALRSAILAGIFFALSALSSWYYAPMFAIGAIVYALVVARPWDRHLRSARFWRGSVAAVLLALVLMAPALVETARLRGQREMTFTLREVDLFSASIGDLVAPNALHPLWGWWAAEYWGAREDVLEYMVGLSWVGMGLAAVGVWGRRKQRMVQAMAALAIVSAILALGTTLHLGGDRLLIPVPEAIERVFTAAMGCLVNRMALHPMPSYYEFRVPRNIYLPLPALWLYLYVPLFDSMRVWSRFALLTGLALAILAAAGWARLAERLGSHLRWASAGLVLLVLFGSLAAPFTLGWSQVRAQSVDAWLAEQPTRGSVIVLPLWKAEHGLALYATRVHDKPVAFGYGAFFPRWYRERRPTLWGFPNAESIALLRAWNVQYVLVGAESYGAEWPKVQREIDSCASLRLLGVFDEQPVYHPGAVARALPDLGRAFIVDRINVYELQ